MTCKNCKHWRQDDEYWNAEKYAGYGRCQRIPHGNGDEKWGSKPSGEAFVEDGSGYYACLITHEEFSCVLFGLKVDS